jgi:hypothetical protein
LELFVGETDVVNGDAGYLLCLILKQRVNGLSGAKPLTSERGGASPPFLIFKPTTEMLRGYEIADQQLARPMHPQDKSSDSRNLL